MSIKIGGTNVTNVTVGEDAVKLVNVGDTSVFNNFPTSATTFVYSAGVKDAGGTYSEKCTAARVRLRVLDTFEHYQSEYGGFPACNAYAQIKWSPSSSTNLNIQFRSPDGSGHWIAVVTCNSSLLYASMGAHDDPQECQVDFHIVSSSEDPSNEFRVKYSINVDGSTVRTDYCSAPLQQAYMYENPKLSYGSSCNYEIGYYKVYAGTI